MAPATPSFHVELSCGDHNHHDGLLTIDEQDGIVARRKTHLGADRLPTTTVEAREAIVGRDPQRAVRRLGKLRG